VSDQIPPHHEPEDDAESEDPSIREQLTEVRDSLSDLTRTVGSRTARAGKRTAERGREQVTRGVRTVTLREYRDEVDRALEDIVEVLTDMDARIRALERHVGDPGAPTPAAEEDSPAETP